MITQMSR